MEHEVKNRKQAILNEITSEMVLSLKNFNGYVEKQIDEFDNMLKKKKVLGYGG